MPLETFGENKIFKLKNVFSKVRVLQAIDSVHNQLGIYCICLVLPNQLPKVFFLK